MGGFSVCVGGEGGCLLEAALAGFRIDSPVSSTLSFQPTKGTAKRGRILADVHDGQRKRNPCWVLGACEA